ncbi:GTRBP1 [Auxenochlorella protothecoides x Auxenochlorella symbiontica]
MLTSLHAPCPRGACFQPSKRPLTHLKCRQSCVAPLCAAPGRPGPANTARTLVDLTSHGTLATLLPDGTPLGTATSYVLDGTGQPILRLRAHAVHTDNLRANPATSLFVHPANPPARALARLTLLGHAEAVPENLLPAVAEVHATLAAGGQGVDAPSPSDVYMRLHVTSCFLVDQLGGGSAAQRLTREEYLGGVPDALRGPAAGLVTYMNASRTEDLLNLGADAMGCSPDDLATVELVWLDSLGFYIRTVPLLPPNEPQTLRLTFLRPVADEREARSALTMMAQESWERRRPYNPVMVTT